MPPRTSIFARFITSCIPKSSSRSRNRYTAHQKVHTYTVPGSKMPHNTTAPVLPQNYDSEKGRSSTTKDEIRTKFKSLVRSGTIIMHMRNEDEAGAISKGLQNTARIILTPAVPSLSSRPGTSYSAHSVYPAGPEGYFSVPPVPPVSLPTLPASPPKTPKTPKTPSLTTPASQPRNKKQPELKDFDIQFLIDDSGSMRGLTSSGRTHWEEVKDVLSKMVTKCASNNNTGVDVFFLNSILVNQFNGLKITKPENVMWLFEERRKDGIRGSTPTAEALDLILAPYLRECESNPKNLPQPRNIIVITDGAANNNNLLQENLVDYAKRLDNIRAPPHQIKVQFFQVGNVKGVDESFRELNEAKSMVRSERTIVYTKSTIELGADGLTAEKVMSYVEHGINPKSQR